MRQLRSHCKTAAAAASSGLTRPVLFLMLTVVTLLVASGAFANDLTAYAVRTTNNTNVVLEIFNYICFLSGCVLVGLGISELRRLSDGSAGGSLQLKHPVSKLGFGGLMMAIPFLTLMLQGTMGGPSGNIFAIVQRNNYEFDATAIKANGISGMMAKGVDNSMILIDVANVAAFIIGVFFCVRGIQMLRAHIENPGQSPVAESLKRLAVGGALLSFPVIVNVVYETFGARGSALGNTGWTSSAAGGDALDTMFIKFMQDITNPAFKGIELFCYISGILMILFALQRLVRTAQDGPRGPLGFGTIVMFIVSGCLLSFPQLLSVLNTSIFGSNSATTMVTFMSDTGIDEAQLQNAKNVFSAVLAFMAVIGFLSVVRGLFLLKAFADGNQQASMMSVATHLVAGSIAINLGSFINAIQKSLGVTSVITFN